MADRNNRIWLKNIVLKKINPYRTWRPSFEEKNENDFAAYAAVIFQQQFIALELLSRHVNRTIWEKVRSKVFWATCRKNWTNKDYIANLRVDKETFLLIVQRLTPYIQRKTTVMRPSIAVDERVAIALWRFSSGDSSRTISWMFGVGESTCTETCLEVAQAICEDFGPEYLATPTHEEFKEQAELFERGRGFPMCIGARDGTHIPIRGSFGRRKLLWRFKGFYSIVLQIVARADYRILTATVGHAGNSHDSTIMKKTFVLAERRRNFPIRSQSY